MGGKGEGKGGEKKGGERGKGKEGEGKEGGGEGLGGLSQIVCSTLGGIDATGVEWDVKLHPESQLSYKTQIL